MIHKNKIKKLELLHTGLMMCYTLILHFPHVQLTILNKLLELKNYRIYVAAYNLLLVDEIMPWLPITTTFRPTTTSPHEKPPPPWVGTHLNN